MWVFCDRFYFACESGLIKKSEVPQQVGLIAYSISKDNWYVVKTSRRHTADLNQIEWMSLLFAKVLTIRHSRELKKKIDLREDIKLRDRAKNLGYDIRLQLREVDDVENTIKDIKVSIAKGLGLPGESLVKCDNYSLERTIRDIMREQIVPQRVKLATAIVNNLSAIVSGKGFSTFTTKHLIDDMKELQIELQKEV